MFSLMYVLKNHFRKKIYHKSRKVVTLLSEQYQYQEVIYISAFGGSLRSGIGAGYGYASDSSSVTSLTITDTVKRVYAYCPGPGNPIGAGAGNGKVETLSIPPHRINAEKTRIIIDHPTSSFTSLSNVNFQFGFIFCVYSFYYFVVF